MNVRQLISEELHSPARRFFPRRRVILKSMFDLYQADILELQEFAKENKGHRYILLVINCFSKYAFGIPLKTKTAIEVSKALEPILKKHKMKHFQTDNGTEFYNSHTKKLFQKYKINHYSTFSELKSSIAERLVKTIKSKLYKMFTMNCNRKWLNELPSIMKSYNTTVHRTTNFRPIDVSEKNQKLILSRLNYKPGTFKPKFKVNDMVRISRYKKVFTKGYMPNWSNETFKIILVKRTNPVTYILQDGNGQRLAGCFYSHELRKTTCGNIFLVEKILRKKGNKLLVRWLGFDQTSDSWIDKTDLV